MDASQTVTFAGLICMAVAPYFIWIWHFRDLYKARIQGKAEVWSINLEDIVIVVFLCPFMLTGATAAVWLYYKGWEDFTRTILISIGGGFIGGGLLASFMVIFSLIRRRIIKNRRNPHE